MRKSKMKLKGREGRLLGIVERIGICNGDL